MVGVEGAGLLGSLVSRSGFMAVFGFILGRVYWSLVGKITGH